MSEGRIVNVPGRGEVEFPADMSDKEVDAVIKKNAMNQRGRDITTSDGIVIKNVPYNISPDDALVKNRAHEIRDSLSRRGQIPEKPPPTMGQTIAANPASRFLYGAVSPIVGGAQLAAHVNPPLKDAGLDKWIDGQIRAMEEAQRAGGGTWVGDAVQTAGEVASPLGAAAKVKIANSALGRVGTAMGLGATSGLLTPVTNPGPDMQGSDFLSQKGSQVMQGAVLGPAAMPVAAAGGLALRTGANLIDPLLPGGMERVKRRQLGFAAGDKKDEILALLERNQQIVPGSQAGAGEVAAPAGRAEFSGLQRLAEQKLPSDYLAMEGAQDAARLAAVRTVGQTPAALAAAEAARSQNAAVNYGQVRNDRINPLSDQRIMQDEIARREAARVAALQTEGRYNTVAAQQAELAAGRGPVRSPQQSMNEPQINVGATGVPARSPTAYPVEGQPRFPARYTENWQRIPEAQRAAADAGQVAQRAERERKHLESTLDLLQQTVGMGDKSLNDFLKKPSIRAAVQDAIKSAQETGSYYPRVAGDRFSVQNLQRIKESLDARILAAKKATDAGRTPELSPQELQDTKAAFTKWLGSKSPGWENARAEFRADSVPINQMKVGQYLESKLNPALNDLDPNAANQRGALFAGALRDAPGTIQNSAGGPRFTNLTEVLNPKQVQTVTDVGRDLGRRAQYETQARRGLPAAKEITGAFELPPTGMFNPVISTARALINRLQGKLSKEALISLAKDMKDPAVVHRIMSELPAKDRDQIIKEVMGRGALMSGAAASSLNAQRY